MTETSSLKLETWKNLPILQIRNDAAEAKIALHGAHVLSYRPAGEREVLWLSEESWAEPGKPIRGGIPVCWPWFGPAQEPAHGVARINEWALKESVSDPASTVVKFEAFAYENLIADVTVTVADKLTVELTTTNLGPEEFRLTQALHSYFSISNISSIRVRGLEGAEYIDTLTSTRHHQEGPIEFRAETDRIYDHSHAECVIDDPAFEKKIHVAKEGSMSTVVWNPWVAKSRRLPDFGDREYNGMVCIESANVGNDFRILKAGEKQTLKTIISLV